MTAFVGRFAELRALDEAWVAVRDGRAPASSPPQDRSRVGGCVVVSGPRAVGKTRLIGEFLKRANARSLFFAADGSAGGSHSLRRAGGSSDIGPDSAERDLAAFAAQAAASALPHAARFRDILVPDWDTALGMLSGVAQDEAGSGGRAPEPCVVVIDNASALIAADGSFVPALRRIWQRSLSGAPILLILVGRRPSELDGAVGADAVKLAVELLNPVALGQVLDLDPVTALDAYVVTGGHAEIAAQWPTGSGVLEAMDTMLSRSPSVFEIRAERYLARELGLGTQTEALLAATGTEERSRAAIGRISRIPPASLDRGLKQLAADGLLEVERPWSLGESREARYRIADPYLRLWLRAIAPHSEDIARGHVDVVLTDFRAHWPEWRRAAMRIVARGAMDRLAAAGQLPGTGAVGGFWNRFEDVRVDLIGTDRRDNPQSITFVGVFKWDAAAPVDAYDLASLIAMRGTVPGVTDTTPLVAVSLAGSSVGDAVAAVLGPNELISAWQR